MRRSHLSVFDLDRTLVKDNCSFAFCQHLVRKKILPPLTLIHSLFYYVRHSFFGMSLSQLHTKVFGRLLQGRPISVIEEQIDPFLQEYLFSHLYSPALAALRSAQKLGHHTLILSNSPSFLVKKIAGLLEVDQWRATEYAVDKESKLCHIATIMQGEEKASCVQEIASKLSIGKEGITAYSDSFLDLPLLLVAGTPIAVSPDRKLRRYSEKCKWQIL